MIYSYNFRKENLFKSPKFMYYIILFSEILLCLNILIISFFLFNHPMTILILIISTTIIISILRIKFLKIIWLSLILILLILGGILILFLYLISLIPNKKIIFKKKILLLLAFGLIINFNTSNQVNLSINTIINLFFPPSIRWLLFIIIYLLLTLIVVIIIIESSKAPIKLYK